MTPSYFYAFAVTTAVGIVLQGCGSSGDGDNGSPMIPSPMTPADANIETEPAFPGLAVFAQPVAMVQAPADDSRWFVVERAGRVLVFDNRPDVTTSNVVIDMRGIVASGPGESGLLGMTFHPAFADNGQVYLSYTRSGLVSYVSRFVSFDGGQTLDPDSEVVMLTVNQDFDNHNGGNIAFGPDGLLYIGFGDGGSANDPLMRAQDTTNVLGAMLRIDVDGASPYAIPEDNPFHGNGLCEQGFGGSDCPELFAWGLRNPWRWSVDRGTGELWAGDVGQGRWEEVDVIALGGNYGWPIREGAHCNIPASDCPTSGLTDPVVEYGHDQGQSITGGYVYRGNAIPALVGSYVYGDFVSGRIWGTFNDEQGGLTSRELLDTALNIASFAQGNDGELYVLDYATGMVQRIVESASP